MYLVEIRLQSPIIIIPQINQNFSFVMRMKKQNVQQSFRWMSGLLGEGRSSNMWVLKETGVCKNKIINKNKRRKAVLFVTRKWSNSPPLSSDYCALQLLFQRLGSRSGGTCNI